MYGAEDSREGEREGGRGGMMWCTSLPSGYWGVFRIVCQASMPTLLVPGNLFSFLSSPSLPITNSSKEKRVGGAELLIPALSKWLCKGEGGQKKDG